MASIKTHLTLLDGLLAYYKLDGNANDAHTNALHGTPEGIPTWAANCKLRQGLQLNGSSQCVSLGLSSLLCPGNITLSCWAYVDSTGGAYQTMINKRYYAPGGGYTVISYIFTIYLPTNLITTVVSSGDSAPYWHQIDYSAGSGIRNSWHHYAMTYDGSVLAVYLDGFLRQTLTGCLGPIKERPTIATLIGARTGDSGEPSRYDYFKGYIDEVLISGRAFTPAEVLDLYHTGYPLRYEEVVVGVGENFYGFENLSEMESGYVFVPVTDFVAVTGPVQRQISLSWTNPVHPDFLKVIVRRSDVSFPPSPSSGDLVYEGSNEATIDTDLDASKTYYYSIFAFDSYGTYSVAVTQSCKPEQVPVTDFEGVSGIRKIEMTWTNPVCPEFVGVMLRRSEITYPATPTDGIQVYNGTDADYTDDGLDNAKTYYYSIFAYITGFEYAEAATGSWSTLIIPNVTDVVAISSIVVRVTYDREMKHTSSSNPDDSLNPTNYAITGGDVPIVVSDVDIVQSNPTIVDLIVNEMKNEESYHLIVSNVKSLESEQNLDNNDGDFEGIGIPPQVEIRPVDSENRWVKIQYSEIMGSSVLVLGNYSINPELNILGVSSVTSTIFKLVTEPQTSGVDYVLTVSLDVKDQVGNAISPENRTVLFRGKRIDYSESTVFDYFSSAGSNRRIGPVEGVGIVTVEVPSDKPE